MVFFRENHKAILIEVKVFARHASTLHDARFFHFNAHPLLLKVQEINYSYPSIVQKKCVESNF